jgi:predicted acyltransferase
MKDLVIFLKQSAYPKNQSDKTPAGNISDKSTNPVPAEQNVRLLSIDALRGFDMLFIAGGGTFLALMKGKTGWPWVDFIARQMHHATWDGRITFYDLIFPIFLFLAGASLTFSVNKELSKGRKKSDIYLKAFWRMLIFIGIDIVYKNPGISFFEPSNIRYLGILGRIGLTGFITTILFLNFPRYSRLILIASILLLYYAALFLIPVPGYGAGDLSSMESNFVGWLDRTLLPGRLVNKIYDENGLTTQFPALCLTIMGSLAGDILRCNWKESRKIKSLILAGLACLGLGFLWGLHFRISRHLWSSSFILVSGGWAFLFMSLFYWSIDVMKYQKWAFFFKVIGMNALATYLLYYFINFYYTSNLIFFGLYAPTPEPWHKVFEAIGALSLVWLTLYFMYRKKIFLKI